MIRMLKSLVLSFTLVCFSAQIVLAQFVAIKMDFLHTAKEFITTTVDKGKTAAKKLEESGTVKTIQQVKDGAKSAMGDVKKFRNNIKEAVQEVKDAKAEVDSAVDEANAIKDDVSGTVDEAKGASDSLKETTDSQDIVALDIEKESIEQDYTNRISQLELDISTKITNYDYNTEIYKKQISEDAGRATELQAYINDNESQKINLQSQLQKDKQQLETEKSEQLAVVDSKIKKSKSNGVKTALLVAGGAAVTVGAIALFKSIKAGDANKATADSAFIPEGQNENAENVHILQMNRSRESFNNTTDSLSFSIIEKIRIAIQDSNIDLSDEGYGKSVDVVDKKLIKKAREILTKANPRFYAQDEAVCAQQESLLASMLLDTELKINNLKVTIRFLRMLTAKMKAQAMAEIARSEVYKMKVPDKDMGVLNLCDYKFDPENIVRDGQEGQKKKSLLEQAKDAKEKVDSAKDKVDDAKGKVDDAKEQTEGAKETANSVGDML